MNRRWVVGFFLFFAAFLLYLYGTYPSVSVGDSGEFITDAQTLGIPHAPGYPSYVLLAKYASRLIPWGNAGYRVNLFSALCGAMAIAGLFFFSLQLGFSSTAAVFA